MVCQKDMDSQRDEWPLLNKARACGLLISLHVYYVAVLHAGDMPQIFEGTLNPEKGMSLFPRPFSHQMR